MFTMRLARVPSGSGKVELLSTDLSEPLHTEGGDSRASSSLVLNVPPVADPYLAHGAPLNLKVTPYFFSDPVLDAATGCEEGCLNACRKVQICCDNKCGNTPTGNFMKAIPFFGATGLGGILCVTTLLESGSAFVAATSGVAALFALPVGIYYAAKICKPDLKNPINCLFDFFRREDDSVVELTDDIRAEVEEGIRVNQNP